MAESIRFAALNVGQTGSLEHLLQFISGVVFGWESVEQELVKSDELSEDEDEAESCETQYFPDAFLHVPDAHEDSGLHLDDQDWRFNECSDHEEPQSKSVRTLLPNDGHGSSLSSPRAEKKGQEKRANEKQIAPISTTPTNLLQPRPGGTQPQPSSTHNMAARSLDIKQPVSSQNSALKEETPKSSHTTSQTPHTVSKMRGKGLANGSPQHSPNETTEEVVAKSHSHLKPSANPPVTNKRRRAEDDNGEDTLVGERAHQRQKTLDGVSGQNYDLQHVP